MLFLNLRSRPSVTLNSLTSLLYLKTMTTFWKEEASESAKSPHRFYIHIQNLPNIVCQAEIKSLLNEFDVPKGGISIYGSDAFVAFTDTQMALDAFSRTEILLLGTPMRPSLVTTTKAVKQAIGQKVRRNLNFNNDDGYGEKANDWCDSDKSSESGIVSDDETPEVIVSAYGRKRIRPTSIPPGFKRIPFSCFMFFPEEILFPRRTSENIPDIFIRNVKQLRCRKIRPKPAIYDENFEDWEKSADEYPGTKRIKLEQSDEID